MLAAVPTNSASQRAGTLSGKIINQRQSNHTLSTQSSSLGPIIARLLSFVWALEAGTLLQDTHSRTVPFSTPLSKKVKIQSYCGLPRIRRMFLGDSSNP